MYVCVDQAIDKRQAWDAGLARKAPRDTLANNDGFLDTLFRCAGRSTLRLYLVRVGLVVSFSKRGRVSIIELVDDLWPVNREPLPVPTTIRLSLPSQPRTL